jgi:hypothetical protein
VAGYIPDLFWMKATGEYGPRAVDPGSVWSLWTAAGGTTETPLSEAEAVGIAQAVGAGRLVYGVVAGTEARMSVTATLLEVPSGRVRVRQTTVEGPYEDYIALTERLINQLLVTDWGVTADRIPELAAYDPLAVQAFLRGRQAFFRMDYRESTRLFRDAMEVDSTFVLAAFTAFKMGELDRRAARFAWDRRDQLNSRDRAELQGLAGWLFGATRTVAERVAQFDSIGLRDWETDVDYNLHTFGRLASIPEWRERSRAAFLHRRSIGHLPVIMSRYLFEIAADEGDTAAMRIHSEEMGRSAAEPTASLQTVAAQLLVSLRQGDTASAARLWEQADSLGAARLATLDPFPLFLVYGVGLDELDRYMLSQLAERPDGSTPEPLVSDLAWARARGRYHEWSQIRDRLYEHHWTGPVPLALPVMRIRDALFLGEPEDSTVWAAASWLDSVAAGTITLPPDSYDPTPEIRRPAVARCWSALWKVTQGDTEVAPEAVRYLREDVPLPYRYSVCAGLIEVMVAQEEDGDVRSAVLALDSIVRPVPMEPPLELHRDRTHWVDNLFLSRMLVQVGDTAKALAAARRAKPWAFLLAMVNQGIFVDQLREEARLTAMVGDTAGAIDAYRHYFALRDFRPDHPPWAAQWDSMRVEYGVLTGVEGP